jgi:hypothetical protein
LESYDENGDAIQTTIRAAIKDVSGEFTTQADGKIHIALVEYYDTKPDSAKLTQNDPKRSGFIFVRRQGQTWDQKNLGENDFKDGVLQPAAVHLEELIQAGQTKNIHIYGMNKYHQSDLGVTYVWPGDTLVTFFGTGGGGYRIENWQGEYINTLLQTWLEGDTTTQISQNNLLASSQVAQGINAASILKNGEELQKHRIITVYSPSDPAWNLPNKNIVKRWPQSFLANVAILNPQGNIIESHVFSGVTEPISYGMLEEHFEAMTGTDEIRPYHTSEVISDIENVGYLNKVGISLIRFMNLSSKDYKIIK